VTQLEELDALFDKFKRLDDSLVRTTRGSGLGLFITRELVSVMGGSIKLSYEDGAFKVRFTIPLYQEAAAPVPA
jgi:signal transduction histidine kinase